MNKLSFYVYLRAGTIGIFTGAIATSSLQGLILFVLAMTILFTSDYIYGKHDS